MKISILNMTGIFFTIAERLSEFKSCRKIKLLSIIKHLHKNNFLPSIHQEIRHKLRT